MVARINFRLIIFFLIFLKLQGVLNSQDKMNDINISINQALENYKSNKLQNAAPHLALYERNFKKAWQGSSTDRYKKPKTLFIFKL